MTRLREMDGVGRTPQHTAERRNGSEFDETRVVIGLLSGIQQLLFRGKPDAFLPTVDMANAVANFRQNRNASNPAETAQLQAVHQLHAQLGEYLGVPAAPVQDKPQR